MRGSLPFNRRDVLRLCGAAGVFGAMNNQALGDGLTPARDAVDHLLLGSADLDRGMAWVEEKTGVKPARGGSHPGVGTRNALLSLGGRHYLEIIAVDPAQTQFGPMAESLKGLAEPRLVTWAAAAHGIDAMAQKARSAGCTVNGPQDGSRMRPNGQLLKWKSFRVNCGFGDVIPFFIEWGAGVVHPSEDSPSGCKLTAFELAHPQAERVRDVLGQLGIEGVVKQGAAQLKAMLTTPKGMVELR